MLKKATIFILALLITLLNGCSWNHTKTAPECADQNVFIRLAHGCSWIPYRETQDVDLIEVSNDATSTLQDKLTSLPKNSLIIVSTILNVNNLNQTSSFGRIISDQIASAFYDSGYRIIGMEMPIDLFVMENDGSLKLSDETKAILKSYHAAVIVGGVYAPGKKNTYVSLRIVDLNTKDVISSTNFSVPMGPDARKLLESKEVGSAGSRSELGVKADDPAVKVDESTGEVVPAVEGEKQTDSVKPE